MSSLRPLRLWVLFDVHRRRHPVLVLLIVAVCEFTFLYLVRMLGPPRKFVGIPGAGAVIIALAAATLEGPWVGAIAVAIAGAAFTSITADFGHDVELLTVAYSVLLWLVATVAAGLTADQARRQIMDREQDLSLALSSAVSSRDAIQRLLELGPVFFSADGSERLEKRICEAARSLFDAGPVWLLGVHDQKLEVRATSGVRSGEGGNIRGARVLPGDSWMHSSSFLLVAPGVRSPEWLTGLVRPLGVRAVMTVPISVQEQATDLLVVTWTARREGPLPAEEALFRRFADQAALALERAEVDRLHTRLEASLLPRMPILHPTLHVESYYLPGERRLGLGGDFFDFLTVGGTGAAFLVGDVSGHDVDSAGVAAVLRATWRALVLAGETLEATMRTMSDVLQLERADPGLYATVVAGVVSPQGDEVTLVSFGHPSPLLIASGPQMISIPPAFPLGFWDGVRWTETTLALPTAWTLFLYTDGLMEGFAGDGTRARFGVEGLLRSLNEPGIREGFGSAFRPKAAEDEVAHDTQSALEMLLQVVQTANEGPLPDDVAILVIHGGAGE